MHRTPSNPLPRGNRPLVGVTADRRLLPDHPHRAQLAGDNYLEGAIDGAGVFPVVLPSMDAGFAVTDILDRLDGLLLTGSPSNVMPECYGAPAAPAGTWQDPDRDRAVLGLLPAAVEAGIPVLAICRGLQEMNVAWGGSLHPAVHDVPGHFDHRDDKEAALEDRYRESHPVRFREGGLLERLSGQSSARVNSLHAQGVDRLGAGLEVEAEAGDGLVEAFTVRNAPGFTLAVQWHPEWRFRENPLSMAIFSAFGDACRAYRMRHWTR